jgi:hypothetical protein
MNGADFEMEMPDVREVVVKVDSFTIWRDGSTAPVKFSVGYGVMKGRESLTIKREGSKLVVEIVAGEEAS